MFLSENGRRGSWILILSVVLLALGFVLGSIQYRYGFFSFAEFSGDSPVYTGPDRNVPVPREALSVAQSVEKALNFAARVAKPSVVTIYTKKQLQGPGFPFHYGPGPGEPFEDFFRRFFPEEENRSREVTGLGSGVIIREDGYILTNHHVIQQSDEIEVLLSNRHTAPAEIVASDEQSDLAVIKIDRTGLPPAEFADSDRVKIGQWALAVGTPFQLNNSVSVGHVSAVHRSINFRRYEDLIQTDAPINQGNSGGPLVNIHGEVIGINTLILSQSGGNQGVGFAISSNLAKRSATDLIEFGRVKRPWLGVVIQEITPEMAEHVGTDRGVIIADVKENSPADGAGLEAGDVILEFDGRALETPHELQRLVLGRKIDSTVSLRVRRKDGTTGTVSVTLGLLPEETDRQAHSEPEARESQPPSGETGEYAARLGMKLTEISEEEARQEGITPPRQLVRVEGVQRGSAADRANLRGGDVILRIGNEPVSSVKQLESRLVELRDEGEDKALLHVHRRQNFFTLLPLNP